jgi:hypothetical protein
MNYIRQLTDVCRVDPDECQNFIPVPIPSPRPTIDFCPKQPLLPLCHCHPSTITALASSPHAVRTRYHRQPTVADESDGNNGVNQMYDMVADIRRGYDLESEDPPLEV